MVPPRTQAPSFMSSHACRKIRPCVPNACCTRHATHAANHQWCLLDWLACTNIASREPPSTACPLRPCSEHDSLHGTPCLPCVMLCFQCPLLQASLSGMHVTPTSRLVQANPPISVGIPQEFFLILGSFPPTLFGNVIGSQICVIVLPLSIGPTQR